MKRYFTIFQTTLALFVASFFAVACTSSEAENTTSHTNPPVAVVQENDQNDLPQQPVAELPKDQVCMVNNAFMGKKQIPVAHESKTYYGCCEMCVEKIKTNKAVRFATDPQSGKEVDKSTAFIVLNPANNDGSVLYFESEANFKSYQANVRLN